MLKLNRKQVISVVFASLVTVGSIGCSGNGGDSETSNEGNDQQQENATQGNDPQGQQREQRQGQQRQGQQRQGQQRQPMQQGAGDIEVSDEELKKFQDAQQEVSSVQEDSRSKMESAVKDEGLSMERFREISQQQMQQQKGQQGQQGQQQQTEDLDISDEEMEKFQNAREQVMEIQKSVQQDLMKAVKDAGISPQRYQEISRAMRSDKELQQRMQSMQGEEGGQNQSMP